MRLVDRVLASIGLIALLAGCGGGAGSKPSIVPATTASSTATASKANASATLTLHFPANFHHAYFPPPKPKVVTVRGRTSYLTVSATPARNATSSTRKSPAYVNPGSGNIIHVFYYNDNTGWVEATPSGGVTLPSNPQPDGSQIVSAAFTAGSYKEVEVQETDASGDELAAGYVQNTVISAGTSNPLQITMDMNAQYVVLTTDPVAGSDATVISTDSGNPTSFCSYPNGSSPFYAFAADLSGGFVLPGTAAGAGYSNNEGINAIPVPALNGSYSTLASTPLGMQSLFTGSNMTQNASFVENNPDYGGRSYGYATIGDNGSTPCTLSASYSEDPANVGDSVAMTVFGGNPPYNVTESDGFCTVTEADATTRNWTLVPQYSGGTCSPNITDRNSGNAGSAPLSVNESAPLGVSPPDRYYGFLLAGQVVGITATGGVAPYTFSQSTDTSVMYFYSRVTEQTVFMEAGENYTGCASLTITDAASATVTWHTSGCP